jgi:phosphoribosylformylglycinamidine cyclo-ligase
MPGFYRAGEYDLSGTIVGVVERDRLLDGPRSIRPGDAVLGLASSGLHTNGYSLARQICFERLKLKPSSRVPELGATLGDELLKIHRSYGPLILALLRRFNGAARGRVRSIRALAHVTGGGFVDNIPRVLPAYCDVVIRRGSWDVLPVFRWLQERGRVAEAEMYQVFNMGIGMILVVQPDRADSILRFIRRRRQPVWVIGEVVRGTRKVRLA